MAKGKKSLTGISLDREVLDYITALSEEEDRSRSSMINRIIKEHAARNGKPIPSRPNRQAQTIV